MTSSYKEKKIVRLNENYSLYLSVTVHIDFLWIDKIWIK